MAFSATGAPKETVSTKQPPSMRHFGPVTRIEVKCREDSTTEGDGCSEEGRSPHGASAKVSRNSSIKKIAWVWPELKRRNAICKELEKELHSEDECSGLSLYQERQKLIGKLNLGAASPSSHCTKYTAAIRRFSAASDEDKYIFPKSKANTFHFQDSLPRLPIPKLEDTCRRYLDAQKPLLDSEEYEQTKKLVEKFQRDEGPVLNAELIGKDKKNKHTSYISEPWFDMYLTARLPLVLNHNPFIAWKEDPQNMDQLVRATNIIKSAVKFKFSLDDTILEPDIFHLKPEKSDTEWFKNLIRFVPRKLAWYGAFLVKAFPLDMSQYARLFCSTRIPHHGKDKLATFESARHMVVMKNGHFYAFDVITTDGQPVSTAVIYQNLKAVASDDSTPPQFPVAALTSENRDTWASLRQAMELDQTNHESLKVIDSAVFILCLDDNNPESAVDATQVFLHGDGINRWFDKSLQVIVCKNGQAAVTFEHAWGDGVAVVRFLNEVFEDTTTKPACTVDTVKHMDGQSSVQKLQFSLSTELERGIQSAKDRFDQAVQSLDVSEMQMMTYGKDYIKTKKLSPDALMQLAFQIAYYRQNGGFGATYESCSTAAFKHGRTETIRSASNATVACAEAFQSSHRAGVDEMVNRIRQACDWHAKLTKEAAMGQGFDRHLFALRLLAEASCKVPDLFSDPAYSRINHVILSTSTLSSPAIFLGGFGPVVKDGLGIGYGIQDDWLGCNVSCYLSQQDVRGFLECVHSSLLDIHSVLEGRNFKE